MEESNDLKHCNDCIYGMTNASNKQNVNPPNAVIPKKIELISKSILKTKSTNDNEVLNTVNEEVFQNHVQARQAPEVLA